MKALTIKQPWLALILAGLKRYEFRTWAPGKVPTKILLHSSAGKLSKAEMGFYRDELTRCRLERAADLLEDQQLLKGYVLATAELSAIYDCRLPSPPAPAEIPRTPGHGALPPLVAGELYAWHLRNIRPLEGGSVAWKGAQGLWEVDWELVRAAAYLSDPGGSA